MNKKTIIALALSVLLGIATALQSADSDLVTKITTAISVATDPAKATDACVNLLTKQAYPEGNAPTVPSVPAEPVPAPAVSG